MAASSKTVIEVGQILFEEIGSEKALKIVQRIANDVDGNKSFLATVQALLDYLQKVRINALENRGLV
jgi:hypothetical protein